MIYHICTKDEYYRTIINGEYRNETLEKVGFIHCSLEKQVEDVVNSRLKGTRNLILLAIDDKKVKEKI